MLRFKSIFTLKCLSSSLVCFWAELLRNNFVTKYYITFFLEKQFQNWFWVRYFGSKLEFIKNWRGFILKRCQATRGTPYLIYRGYKSIKRHEAIILVKNILSSNHFWREGCLNKGASVWKKISHGLCNKISLKIYSELFYISGSGKV